MQKPSEALPSQVFQVVAKVIKGQRAYFALDQTTKDAFGGGLERTLTLLTQMPQWE